MSQRDTGWIQLYCSSAQEVLDSVLCAYRIAETVMLPVMVCAEGFLLSHTSEVVDVPEQDAVDAFLPELRPPDDWLLDPDEPRAFSGAAASRRTTARSSATSPTRWTRRAGVIETVASEFTSHFGREKVGALEVAGNPDADTALVTIGTIGDTAQRAARRRRRPAARPRPRVQAVPGGGARGRPGAGAPHVSRRRPRGGVRLARAARAAT